MNLHIKMLAPLMALSILLISCGQGKMASNPTWQLTSPNTRIDRSPQLVLWDFATGRSNVLMHAQQVQWSPDGRYLLIVDQGKLCILFKTGVMKNCWPSPTATSDERSTAKDLHNARWSFDSRYIAYVGGARQTANCVSWIEILSADTLKAVHELYFVTAFYWSPATNDLAYVFGKSCNHPTAEELHVFHLATGHDDHIAGDLQLAGSLQEPIIAINAEGWSHDGCRLAYVRSAFDIPGAIYTNNATGTDEQKVVTLTAITDDVRWMAGDQHLLYSENTQIDLDGGSIKILTGGKFVSWSPDKSAAVDVLDQSAFIYYVDQAYPGYVGPELWLTANFHTFAWSPDGRRLAFDVPDQTPSLYVGALPDKTAFRIDAKYFKTIDEGHDPTWSPDGLTLAYLTNLSGNP